MGQKQSLCGNAIDLENGDEKIPVEARESPVWTEDSSSSTGSVTLTSSSSSSSSLSIEWTEASLDPCQRKQLVVPCTTAQWKKSVTAVNETDA